MPTILSFRATFLKSNVQFIFFGLHFGLTPSCISQTKADSVLNKPIALFNPADVAYLVEKGYMLESDKAVMGAYMVSAPNKGIDVSHFTYKQLLDSIAALKYSFTSNAATNRNYGNDSVFMRTPSGEKYLLGMGKLSFEKLEIRASKDLPPNYKGDYNLLLNSEKAAGLLTEMLNRDDAWIAGNVLLIEKQKGTINKLRIGDVQEIARRIKEAEEFAPFIDAVK